jgi:Rrf2 family protein
MFSQTVEYALRAMNHLALIAPRPLTSDAIAEQTLVPRQYLAKVMRGLVTGGLVHSQRGRRGGFALAHPPDSIAILDIVDAVDPVRRIERCPLGNPAHMDLCPLHARLDHTIALIRASLGETTLADLLSAESQNLPPSHSHLKSSGRCDGRSRCGQCERGITPS